jgi:LysM repeat protein
MLKELWPHQASRQLQMHCHLLPGKSPKISNFDLGTILSNFAAFKMATVKTLFDKLSNPVRKYAIFMLILSIALPTVGYGQFQPTPVKRSNNRITINGKGFYLHEVVKGQTLYGISKEYETSEEEIKKLNPELIQKIAYPGMVIRIPVIAGTEPNKEGTQEAKYKNHTVLPKENLFSISRQYGIRVDDIKDFNPDVRAGLKIGQVIKIPIDKITLEQKPLVSNEKLEQNISVKTNPTMDKDSSELPCRVKSFSHEKENFRIAIMLPLYLSQNDTLSYTDSLKNDHFRFYEFLEGVYLAIDSMQHEGMSMTVEVFDTERDPRTIKKIIDSNVLDNTDLIIGPVFTNEIEIVSAYSQRQNIPMISPLSTFDVFKSNPYAFQVRNNLAGQMELVSNYLGTKQSQNILVIGRFADRRSPDFTKFIADLNFRLQEQDPARKSTLKTLYFSESSKDYMSQDSSKTDLNKYLSVKANNYVILASENEVFITEIINQLNQKSATFPMQVFGINQWVFSDLDLSNLYNVNLELYGDFEEYPFIDYSDPLVLDFSRKYKKNWNIEPSKYSFLGFDITYFFTKALFLFGPNLAVSVPCWKEYLDHPTMLGPLEFRSKGSGYGYNNQAVQIIRYQKDELIRKRVN